MSGSYIDTDRLRAGVNATVGSVYFGGNRTEQLWVSKRSEQVSECDEIAERGRQDRLAPRSAYAPVVTRPLVMLWSDKWHFTAPSPSALTQYTSIAVFMGGRIRWRFIILYELTSLGPGRSEITHSCASENPAAKVLALAFPLRLIPLFLF